MSENYPTGSGELPPKTLPPQENAPALQPEEAEEQAYLQAKDQEAQNALDKLTASNPELGEGRVSSELEARMLAAGYTDYAVGFNTSYGVDSIDDAAQHLDEMGGIELGMYNLDQRFLIHDKDQPAFMYPNGYYGPASGRFVYAIPVRGESPLPARTMAAQSSEINTENVPDDLYIEGPDGETVVNAKYCAGFIDNQQEFHPNALFMADKESANNEQAEAAPSTQSVISHIGEVGMAGEVTSEAIMPESSESKRSIVGEVREYLDSQGLDIDVQTQKFEDAVKQGVQGIWDKALAEGRHRLNEAEVLQIRKLSQLVEEQRTRAKDVKGIEDATGQTKQNSEAVINAQATADRLAQLSTSRPLTNDEKYAYRKAKQYLVSSSAQ